MCGIAGGGGIEAAAVERALEAIAHRGPDGRGQWISADRSVVLGHRRLSIIDLSSAASQPMVCRRTGNVVTFNGEIYNYRELRSELGALGWAFATASDTEVALAAYGQWGLACFSRFNGMFALGIFDAAARTLVLARDRVGKKPIYYAQQGQAFAFASELKAVLHCLPALPREVDVEALKTYADLGYIPSPLSVFRRIRKLPPATLATLDLQSGDLKLERYWRLPMPDPRLQQVEEAAEELDHLLRDAVRLRLQSDVPVGVFLSGGVDSSLVAAVCAKQAPDLGALTVKFADSAYDESEIARKVAGWIGLPHSVIQAEPSSAADLARLARQFDEPFADSSLVPTHLVSRAARQKFKVALSGDGGDELFAGYDSYDLVMREGYLDSVPKPLRVLASKFSGAIPVGVPGRNFLRRAALDAMDRFLMLYRAPESVERPIVAPSFAAQMESMVDDGYRRSLLADLDRDCTGLSMVQRMTRLDFMSYLPEDVLVKVDRASMLASLEVRSPLLDFRIVELAFRMPDALRYGNGVRKAVLKEVARKYLPPDFPYERKRGFSIPVADWFRSSWEPMLSQAVAPDSRLVDRHALLALQRGHQRTGRFGRQLFQAMMLGFFEATYA
jgi:asparagine synthase (glutamine-hydrolysing)